MEDDVLVFVLWMIAGFLTWTIGLLLFAQWIGLV